MRSAAAESPSPPTDAKCAALAPSDTRSAPRSCVPHEQKRSHRPNTNQTAAVVYDKGQEQSERIGVDSVGRRTTPSCCSSHMSMAVSPAKAARCKGCCPVPLIAVKSPPSTGTKRHTHVFTHSNATSFSLPSLLSFRSPPPPPRTALVTSGSTLAAAAAKRTDSKPRERV